MAKGLPEIWKERLPKAIERAGMQELWLLLRLAEARGRRVPIAELSQAFGLPPAPKAEQDFPALSEFVAASNEGKADDDPERLKLPVVAEGNDDKGWYWMSPELSSTFLRALQGLLSLPQRSAAASSPAS